MKEISMPRAFIIAALAAVVILMPMGSIGKEAKKAATISALQAQEMLGQEGKPTFIIDVRTRAEFALLGHPPQAYNVPWRFGTSDFQIKDGPYQGGKAPYTGYQLSANPNPDFVGVVQSLFKPEDRLIIMSAYGDGGADAADALAKAGFKRVYNIKHGFLGDALTAPDQEKLAEKFSPFDGRRAKVNGWVYWGLPVSHSIDPRYVYPPDLKRMQTLR
jgi:rhodanese-related sulfurtransferase